MAFASTCVTVATTGTQDNLSTSGKDLSSGQISRFQHVIKTATTNPLLVVLGQRQCQMRCALASQCPATGLRPVMTV